MKYSKNILKITVDYIHHIHNKKQFYHLMTLEFKLINIIYNQKVIHKRNHDLLIFNFYIINIIINYNFIN